MPCGIRYLEKPAHPIDWEDLWPQVSLMTEVGLSPLRQEGNIIEGATFLVECFKCQVRYLSTVDGAQKLLGKFQYKDRVITPQWEFLSQCCCGVRSGGHSRRVIPFTSYSGDEKGIFTINYCQRMLV